MSVSSMPLVSVIIAFLDEERYLDVAVRSVLAQTYDRWELLLCDDGSTDTSTGIACGYVEQDPSRIRYFEHPGHGNRGAAATRNMGLAHARGEYVAFLDGDDMWRPAKLGAQVPLLLDHPEVGMVYGKTLFWHDEGQPPGRGAEDFEQDLGMDAGTVAQPPHLLTMMIENEDIHPGIGSLLVRRAVLEDVGGFEESLTLYEDTAMLAKVFLTESVLVAADCSAVYRLHGGSTCHAAVEAGRYHPTEPNPARGAFLTWLESHLLERNVDDRRLWRALRRELMPYRHPVRHGVVKALARVKRVLHPGRWVRDPGAATE